MSLRRRHRTSFTLDFNYLQKYCGCQKIEGVEEAEATISASSSSVVMQSRPPFFD